MWQLVADNAANEQEFQTELEKYSDYFTYRYQDKREVRGNLLLNHYKKELEIDVLFNSGFEDAEIVGEEAYIIHDRLNKTLDKRLSGWIFSSKNEKNLRLFVYLCKQNAGCRKKLYVIARYFDVDVS